MAGFEGDGQAGAWAPAVVGIEEVLGPGGGDAVFVPPAGFVAGGE